MEKKIKKGEGEYRKCPRCEKRFRRRKSFWNVFSNDSYTFYPRCKTSVKIKKDLNSEVSKQ